MRKVIEWRWPTPSWVWTSAWIIHASPDVQSVNKKITDRICWVSTFLICNHFYDSWMMYLSVAFIVDITCWALSKTALRSRQNGRLFADGIFKCIFFNGDVWIWSKISLNFVPKGPINNIPALIQIMALNRPDINPFITSRRWSSMAENDTWIYKVCIFVHNAYLN